MLGGRGMLHIRYSYFDSKNRITFFLLVRVFKTTNTTIAGKKRGLSAVDI